MIPGPTAKSDWSAVLDEFRASMLRLHAHSGLGSRALGVPEWDWQLWRMGREWLACHPGEMAPLTSRDAGPEGPQPDVYLATQLYKSAGHTALIGDFIRALETEQEAGATEKTSAHLILTNVHGENSSPVAEKIRARVGVPASHITVLQGPSLFDRLEQLFALLLKLRPGRLFLFHHPDDPLPSVVAQPEIAGQRILVHHADSQPSFGLHVPGIQIIDLNPNAAALSRLLGLDPALLLLTAPDPGPRPRGFLGRGSMVTATSGSAQKFASRYVYSYLETIGVILRSTGGSHVHIGPLDEAKLEEIHDLLRRENLPADRFVHVPWTSSVASTLWEQGCDVYFSSFPIDGARTNAEVLASATPHLRHSTRPAADELHSGFGIEGGLVWRTWEDLRAALQSLSDRAVLEEKSKLARMTYEKMRHPRVFAEQLKRILSGQGGWEDPQKQERDQRTVHSMLKSLTKAILGRPDEVHGTSPIGFENQALPWLKDNLDERVDFLEQQVRRIERQEQRIDFLQEQRRRLQTKVEQLQVERDQWRKGKTLRSKILRWLMGS